MPIKNYTTSVPASRSVEEIQTALVRHGATGIFYQYEQGTGRVLALKFVLLIEQASVPFSLPVEWRRFQQVLKNDKVSRWKDEEYCYRVAWRCLRDWVLAQLALYETRMVEIPQMFLPFALSKDGATLYEKALGNGGFMLESGN